MKSAQLKSAVWRLKSGADRRFRAGHPWVYSNELQESPKGLEPGAAVELQDAGGGFLARGFGNPSSLIAFRALSRDAGEETPLSPSGLERRLKAARESRAALGLDRGSYRLCFAEADRLPGLIVDHFRLEKGNVFVAQAQAAGADRMLAFLPEVLPLVFGQEEWSRSALVFRNDSSMRKLEGLKEEETQVVKALPELDLGAVSIQVGELQFQVDLLNGQKTGFFLDQAANARQAAQLAAALARSAAANPDRKSKPLRILDLCTYVGQWGATLAKALPAGTEVTLVDSSAAALEKARENVARAGGKPASLKADVLHELQNLEGGSFDIVISDPPALIKGRKDAGAGTHAYLQLHTQALRLVRNGGLVVASSCSALLPEEEFAATLAKAARRNQRHVRWVARGGQAPDHAILAEFPEGRYLKCWMGIVSHG